MALLKLTTREKTGTRETRRLRKQKITPGIVYGHGEANVAVAMSRHDIELAIQRGEQLIQAEVDGESQNFLLKEVQYDYLGQHVIHVDLTRVNLDERVEVTVPIDFRGTPVGVETEDGVLSKHLAELKLECVVTHIPEDVRVSVAELHVNESIHVSDLELPEGVKVLHDPETLLASISIVAEEIEAPAEEGDETPEPEIIGQKPDEDEGDEPAEK